MFSFMAISSITKDFSHKPGHFVSILVSYHQVTCLSTHLLLLFGTGVFIRCMKREKMHETQVFYMTQTSQGAGQSYCWLQ